MESEDKDKEDKDARDEEDKEEEEAEEGTWRSELRRQTEIFSVLIFTTTTFYQLLRK